MKNFPVILAAVLLSVLASYATVKITAHPAAAPAVAEKKETAYDRVMRTGTLRCGYALNPPGIIKDAKTGAITGADHDVVEAVGAELGLKIEWAEEAGWGDFVEGLRNGRFDAFCVGQWPDEARTRFQTLSDPVFYSPVYAYVRPDDRRLDGHIESLNDPAFKIPAIDGDVGMKMAKDGFPKAAILTLPQTASVSDMFLSVTTGKADAVFVEPVAFEDFEKTNKGMLRKVENVEPSFMFSSRFGFNAGETPLRDMVNVALRTLIDSGRAAEIAHRYSQAYVVAQKNY